MNPTSKRYAPSDQCPDAEEFYGGATIDEDGGKRALTKTMVEDILDELNASWKSASNGTEF